MEVNDYVRTKHGIEKITDIKEWVNFRGYEKIITTDKNQYETLYEQSEIIKSSPNIIDILEVGDYVNGGQVREIEKDYIRISGGSYIWQFLKKEEIKSIATKEQFKNIEYEVK